MSRGREKKGSHAIMPWEPCNHLQVTTPKTLLLMNRSIARTLRRSPEEQDGSSNCALHFNSSRTTGNQSGRNIETLIVSVPDEGRTPGHGLGAHRGFCEDSTRNPRMQG